MGWKMNWFTRLRILFFAIITTIIIIAPIMITVHLIDMFFGALELFITGMIICIIWTYLFVSKKMDIMINKVMMMLIRDKTV